MVAEISFAAPSSHLLRRPYDTSCTKTIRQVAPKRARTHKSELEGGYHSVIGKDAGEKLAAE